uniref:Uncharacterized protein n=1 Tax=Arundo donax TaxID=35708 RepID=A0A0A9NA96_ARUDO
MKGIAQSGLILELCSGILGRKRWRVVAVLLREIYGCGLNWFGVARSKDRRDLVW